MSCSEIESIAAMYGIDASQGYSQQQEYALQLQQQKQLEQAKTPAFMSTEGVNFMKHVAMITGFYVQKKAGIIAPFPFDKEQQTFIQKPVRLHLRRK